MKKTTSENLSYETALAELQSIVSDLQSGHCSIDMIAEKVSRAQYLLEFCKTKLRTTKEKML